MSRGIIFYNYSNGSAVRLTVAIYQLRKHYTGEIAIISDGDESDAICKKITDDKGLDVRLVDAFFDVKQDRNHHYLAKCRLHEHTPFDTSLYMDADTIVVKKGMEGLFDIAEEHSFVVPQFSDWKSGSGGSVTRRLMQWKNTFPNDIKPALAFGPAINTGVFCFTKDSLFNKDWFKIARKGRTNFIPDEMSCQLVLHRYSHKVVEWYYNASCKYDKVDDERVKLIHFHGRKHCREGLPFNGAKWVAAYVEAAMSDIGGMQSFTPGGDRKLRHYLNSLSKVNPK